MVDKEERLLPWGNKWCRGKVLCAHLDCGVPIDQHRGWWVVGDKPSDRVSRLQVRSWEHDRKCVGVDHRLVDSGEGGHGEQGGQLHVQPGLLWQEPVRCPVPELSWLQWVKHGVQCRGKWAVAGGSLLNSSHSDKWLFVKSKTQSTHYPENWSLLF